MSTLMSTMVGGSVSRASLVIMPSKSVPTAIEIGATKKLLASGS